jgi:predicted RNase H-like nuclease
MPRQDKKASEIKKLIDTIDENPDSLHLDVTPSVLKLVQLGLPAAQAVLDLLDAPELPTRRRARRVLEGVVGKRFGWLSGQGFPDSDKEAEFRRLLKANGNYEADLPPRERKKSIEKWQRWLAAQEK